MFNRKLKIRIKELERAVGSLASTQGTIAGAIGYCPKLSIRKEPQSIEFETISLSRAIDGILSHLKLSFVSNKGTPPSISLVKNKRRIN